MSEIKEVIIIGGGIIGCTTAYYLTRHWKYSLESTRITILETSAHGAAHGASGKAGGLVARWAYPKELADLSFEEHVKLAEEHDGKNRWGWRFVNCGAWEGRGELLSQTKPRTGASRGGKRKSLEKTLGPSFEESRTASGLPDELLWVREDLTVSYTSMAPTGSTAQVHPYLFTTAMLDLAVSGGVSLVKERATSILHANGQVTGVEYDDSSTGSTKSIKATHVILAAGAWSSRIITELQLTATRAHSITIRPKPDVTIAPYVLFTEIVLPTGRGGKSMTMSPEIYARPDNEVYACGPGDDEPLPESVDDVLVDQLACDNIHRHVMSISDELREGSVEKRQACFLPVVSRGSGPIIGEAESIAKGLFIATGHTCWGICNAPGTARAISELIMDESSSISLMQHEPSLFL